MATRIKITLGSTTQESNSTYNIWFELLPTDIANKWLIELQEFIDHGQHFDDRERFYNFPYSKYTEEYVVDHLNKLIGIINQYSPNLVTKSATLGMPQDTLNYLHHIFEVYHGLYDQQHSNEFFSKAPTSVQKALGDLNIWIHRYETLGGIPRFVGTWYGKPSRKKLAESDFHEFSLIENWGDLKINYCEVGKNLFDIYHDNDTYIDPVAFKPLQYYSVDFTVRFPTSSTEYYTEVENEVWKYYDAHSEFFESRGYKKYDPKLALGWIPVARIITAESKEAVIECIGRHQRIQSIEIIK